MVSSQLQIRVLWCGEGSPIEFEGFSIHSFAFETPLTQSEIEKSDAVVLKVEPHRILSLVEHIRRLGRDIPIFVSANGFSAPDLRQLVNWGKVKFFSREDELFSLLKLEGARESKSSLLRMSREREAMISNLNALVEQKTRSLEESVLEERDRLSREKALTGFADKMAHADQIETLLRAIFDELKKFPDINAFFILTNHKGFFLRGFERGRFIRSRRLNDDFPFQSEGDFRQTLAVSLGRPLGHISSFDLGLAQENFSAHRLLVEHRFRDPSLHDQLVSWCLDRAPLIQLAIDRIIHLEDSVRLTRLWSQAFNSWQDPVAIINKNYELIRSNLPVPMGERAYCHKVLAQRDTPCEGCPLPSTLQDGRGGTVRLRIFDKEYDLFSDCLGEGEYVVHHYYDRTQDIRLYRRLLQAEKMSALGGLAGYIAHELSNPLTGIRSIAQVVLRDGGLDQQTRQDFVEIEKAAARGQGIIAGFLRFSQGEGAPDEVVEADRIVRETLPLLKTLLRRHRTILDLQSEGAFVRVSLQMLQQVIFNLIVNADHAMPDGGSLTIRTRRERGEVIFEVQDTGPGIPEGIRKRVFEPFFTTKPEGHGTGLGLSMAKSIVESFGGQIGFNCPAEGGTCFFIQLPEVPVEGSHS
ncbi:MAG: ATP-binding protein [Bdellovibrionaceae bacterium]|nr:ATP-binding protein [Pseudobdellovibrionaceae bacterium]